MIVPMEQRAAVVVHEVEEGRFIACAPGGLVANELEADVDEQRPDGAPWTTYGLMLCSCDRPDAPERRHWLLSGAKD